MALELWTDGACSGAPGAGGWAAILVQNGTKLAMCGWEAQTTNNRMELTAVIRGLQAAGERSAVIAVYLDSAYVKNAFTHGWVQGWCRNGWKSSRGDDVANRDLWEQLIPLAERHTIRWMHVKGHQKKHSLNVVADALAVNAKKSRTEETRLIP